MTTTSDPARGDHLAEARPQTALISVVMPVRNEERCLGKVLRQLLGQNYPEGRYEVLVVDGGSTDRTRQIVQELLPAHKNLRLLDNPRRWSSTARNIGVRAAAGDMIVIIDGHCELPSVNYLRNLTAAFERSGADCLGRPQPLHIPNPSRFERAIALARESALGHHPASYIYSSQERLVPAHSVAVAYRRSVFEQVGLFDESFDACEDVELNHRIDLAGLRCLLVPELAVAYRPRRSLRALFSQLVRYGRGRMRLLRKHPDTFSVVAFMPAVGLVGALVGWVGSFAWTWWSVAYLLMIAGYGVLVALVSVAIAWRAQQWKLIGTLCAVFITIHLAVAVGVLFEQWQHPGRFKRSSGRPN